MSGGKWKGGEKRVDPRVNNRRVSAVAVSGGPPVQHARITTPGSLKGEERPAGALLDV
ncbi:MAG: hypothetical protein A4E40_00485 [Methanoregulaceae archaeon PtaU1.Bin059]|nr:MAG: hypothetical protein A4E40_00485 [Methanoregulaceae archaeon PtaU1.Bin059]